MNMRFREFLKESASNMYTLYWKSSKESKFKKVVETRGTDFAKMANKYQSQLAQDNQISSGMVQLVWVGGGDVVWQNIYGKKQLENQPALIKKLQDIVKKNRFNISIETLV